jgi:hypothetical protein
MAPPNPVASATPRDVPPTPPASEGPEILSSDNIVADPRWGDASFRAQHLPLYLALNALQDYFSGKMTSERFQKKLKDWTEDPTFADPQEKEFNQAVVDRLHAQLALFQSAQYVTKAQKVKGLLPPATPAPAPAPVVVVAPTPATPAPKKEKTGDPNLSFGLEFQNDTLVSDVLLKEVLNVNADAVLTEKTYFTLKAPITFSGGPLKLMVRPYGGTFSSRAIPGAVIGETGSGYKIGVDVGVANPYGKDFEASGVGLERTGISSYAGEANGIDAPGAVTRLHLFRQKDWSFNVSDRLQLGFNTFTNNQDTFFVLGGDKQLLANGGTDFSTAGNLFAANKLNMLGINLRLYLNGVPQKDKVEDEKGPFRPGEAWAKIGAVAVGSQINRNRRKTIPPFALNRVFLGTFEPLGAQSRAQYDLLGTGLTLFSFQDGTMLADNAENRSDIWRRGDWTERGVMIGLDGVNVLADVIGAANAKADPSSQVIADFAQNPGSVTDFGGRAAKINLPLDLYELGLSGLDASGALGRKYDENKTHYALAHGALFLVGIPLFFRSAPLSGAQCAPDGTFLFKCGFGTTANTKGHYFSPDTFNAGPEDISQVERQYIISSIGASLLSKGATGLIRWAAASLGDKNTGKSTPVAGKETALAPTFGFSMGPSGGMVRVGANW